MILFHLNIIISTQHIIWETVGNRNEKRTQSCGNVGCVLLHHNADGACSEKRNSIVINRTHRDGPYRKQNWAVVMCTIQLNLYCISAWVFKRDRSTAFILCGQVWNGWDVGFYEDCCAWSGWNQQCWPHVKIHHRDRASLLTIARLSGWFCRRGWILSCSWL